MHTTRVTLTLLAITCLPAIAPAQHPPVITLKAATATHPAEFTGIGAIRELADGRVIVLDTTAKEVFVVDFRTGTSAPVSRTGEGPQEYRWPATLVALSGDSSLIVDVQLHRWILLAGDHPVVTVPPQASVIAAGGWHLEGADSRGGVAMIFTAHFADRDIDQGDSLLLVRLDRTTARGDTLARMRSPFGGPPGSARKGAAETASAAASSVAEPGVHRRYMMHPAISDQAIAFPDGWVAVARVAPYRVDWIDPSGHVHRGPPLPVPVTAMNNAEKRAYLAWLSKIDGAPPGDPDDIKEWIPAIPPFWGITTSLFAAPDDMVLIARAPTASLPNPTYDLVDRTGAYRGQLSLRAGEQVAGFGAKTLYVSVTDADGIEHLRRHPWP